MLFYFGIGAWAIIDPVRDALELGDIPSFMKVVGLQVTDSIGYSEVALFVWWNKYGNRSFMLFGAF